MPGIPQRQDFAMTSDSSDSSDSASQKVNYVLADTLKSLNQLSNLNSEQDAKIQQNSKVTQKQGAKSYLRPQKKILSLEKRFSCTVGKSLRNSMTP